MAQGLAYRFEPDIAERPCIGFASAASGECTIHLTRVPWPWRGERDPDRFRIEWPSDQRMLSIVIRDIDTVMLFLQDGELLESQRAAIEQLGINLEKSEGKQRLSKLSEFTDSEYEFDNLHEHEGEIEALFDLLRPTKQEFEALAFSSGRLPPSLLHAWFLDELHLVVHRIRQWYVPIQERSSAVRGRVIPSSIPMSRSIGQLVCVWDEFTLNTPLNQIIATTLEIILSSPPIEQDSALSRYLSKRNRRLAADLWDQMPTIEALPLTEAAHVAQSLPLRQEEEEFRKVLEVAKQVLLFKRGGVDLVERRFAFSLLRQSHVVWEEVVHELWKKFLPEWSVVKEEKTHHAWEKIGGSQGSIGYPKKHDVDHRIYTDKSNSELIALADSKYKQVVKSKIKETDFFQLFFYSTHHDSRTSFLVYPCFPQTTSGPLSPGIADLEFRRNEAWLSGEGQYRLYVVHLPLRGPRELEDPLSAQEQLTSAFEQIRTKIAEGIARKDAAKTI
jgi:5-methylcytosine-specific restriction endonuclease McrBC regulatory subunit McrC